MMPMYHIPPCTLPLLYLDYPQCWGLAGWRRGEGHGCLKGVLGEDCELQGRAPQWLQEPDPNDMPQNLEQLQEHLVLPLSNVFPPRDDGSEGVALLIRFS